MRKGLFWVIGEAGTRQLLTFSVECDENGALCDEQIPYNSRKGDSYVHRQSWALAAQKYPREIRNKPWNHFPRGRVEISNGKATVFHNPALEAWTEFQASVMHEFEIENIPARFVPDGSKHYRFSEDGYG